MADKTDGVNVAVALATDEVAIAVYAGRDYLLEGSSIDVEVVERKECGADVSVDEKGVSSTRDCRGRSPPGYGH